MNKALKVVVFTALTAIFFSCATAPQVKIWRPWMRVLETEPMIPIGSKIVVSVEGNTEPLFGEAKLQDRELTNRLEKNLLRRGFEIDKTGYEYNIQFKFRTERRDKTFSSSYMNSASSNANLNYNASGAAASNIFGLSAALAQSISAMSSRTSTTSMSSTETIRFFTHVVTMSIFTRSGNLIWTGESTWDSPNIDFMSDSKLAIQLILVNLPKKDNLHPEFTKLQDSKVDNFFNLYVANYWFASPALPYRTKFNTGEGNRFPREKIKAAAYLPFFIDLLQTAEDALPTGSKDYKDPTKSVLWSKAMVGGKYLDSKTGKVVSILIDLYGQSSGYSVQKCWIASDSEYSDFEAKMKIWKKALYDYYDVYEK
jgi:hypothetical protein